MLEAGALLRRGGGAELVGQLLSRRRLSRLTAQPAEMPRVGDLGHRSPFCPGWSAVTSDRGSGGHGRGVVSAAVLCRHG